MSAISSYASTRSSSLGRGVGCEVLESEVTSHMLASYEVGDLITMCGWCSRVAVDADWVRAPRFAMKAIEATYTLSHSICPSCASTLAQQAREIRTS